MLGTYAIVAHNKSSTQTLHRVKFEVTFDIAWQIQQHALNQAPYAPALSLAELTQPCSSYCLATLVLPFALAASQTDLLLCAMHAVHDSINKAWGFIQAPHKSARRQTMPLHATRLQCIRSCVPLHDNSVSGGGALMMPT